MRLLLLWVLALLLRAPALEPAPVRVTFTTLTRKTYLAARKTSVLSNPAVTFPLNKTRGRIVIPTDKEAKIFQDKGVGTDSDDQAQFEYKGYLPQSKSHMLVGHYWERTQVLLVPSSGEKQLALYGAPVFSPDMQSFVSIAAGIEYGVYPNEIRLFRLKKGHWQQVWLLEPSVDPATWEPDEVRWISPNTLILKKRMWTGKNPGTTYTYARLQVH
ncbi:hypothetical protein [Hymenobacter arizonensis]|uniref:Uncharacterized protein n=1 Tax=Hymenobacter arizonensis TaxID=1227077 RepID=A0A1I6AUD1_HYMAR|nr:hypothetical protein [Hymenobacter arizonensis]SFQ72300.1 hypothetical protein SAMN04515668_3908 [Hymenobacter arizonensis]